MNSWPLVHFNKKYYILITSFVFLHLLNLYILYLVSIKWLFTFILQFSGIAQKAFSTPCLFVLVFILINKLTLKIRTGCSFIKEENICSNQLDCLQISSTCVCIYICKSLQIVRKRQPFLAVEITKTEEKGFCREQKTNPKPYYYILLSEQCPSTLSVVERASQIKYRCSAFSKNIFSYSTSSCCLGLLKKLREKMTMGSDRGREGLPGCLEKCQEIACLFCQQILCVPTSESKAKSVAPLHFS